MIQTPQRPRGIKHWARLALDDGAQVHTAFAETSFDPGSIDAIEVHHRGSTSYWCVVGHHVKNALHFRVAGISKLSSSEGTKVLVAYADMALAPR